MSALVDGQLDEESAERAWVHVVSCASCRRLVEREGWVKRQLAEMAGGTPSQPPTDLLGSLYDLEPAGRPAPGRPYDGAPGPSSRAEAREAWAVVDRLEQRGHRRRRAGLAAVGVGSVSAAVLGLTTLGAAPLGIGGAPAKPPATSLTRATPTAVTSPSGSAPTHSAPSGSAPTHGPFSGWRLQAPSESTGSLLPVRSTP